MPLLLRLTNHYTATIQSQSASHKRPVAVPMTDNFWLDPYFLYTCFAQLTNPGPPSAPFALLLDFWLQLFSN